ncbi:hypothetical protein SRIMM317S_02507 [Streptomyces rimosus subsp. rimosus]
MRAVPCRVGQVDAEQRVCRGSPRRGRAGPVTGGDLEVAPLPGGGGQVDECAVRRETFHGQGVARAVQRGHLRGERLRRVGGFAHRGKHDSIAERQVGQGFLEGGRQQRVWGHLDEQAVTVLGQSPHGGLELDDLAQVGHPVVGVHQRLGARIAEHRRVERDGRRPWHDIAQSVGHLAEDRVHVAGVRGIVDVDQADGDVSLLPVGDQLAHLGGVPAHHRGGRGCQHGCLDPADAAGRNVRGHAFARQQDRGHGARVRRTGDQLACDHPGAAADDLDPVPGAQGAGDDGSSCFPMEWPMTAAGRTPRSRHMAAMPSCTAKITGCTVSAPVTTCGASNA